MGNYHTRNEHSRKAGIALTDTAQSANDGFNLGSPVRRATFGSAGCELSRINHWFLRVLSGSGSLGCGRLLATEPTPQS